MELAQCLERFLAALRPYPGLTEDLRSGCSPEDVESAQRELGATFPPDLAALYGAHDGQRGQSVGIFKCLSGHSKSSRPRFLPLAEAVRLRRSLWPEGHPDATGPALLIPFAVDDPQAPDDVLAVRSGTGEVFLLWVAVGDPFMPEDWQTAQWKRSESLGEFLLGQVALY